MKVRISTFLLLIFTLLLGISSCSDSDNDEVEKEKYVKLEKSSIELSENEEITITPIFSSKEVAEADFRWSVDQENIVKITPNFDHSATIKALNKGKVTLKIECVDINLSATCEITCTGDGVIRILAIGNSFTDNAMNAHVHHLATKGGKEVVIARLTAGGETLDGHWNNAQQNSKSYSYWKMDKEGKTTTVGGKSMEEALADEKWDYISFQQQSERVGKFDSFEPYIPKLVEYAKNKSQNPSCEYVFFQAWAFGTNYPLSWTDFEEDYGRDQNVMLTAITDVANRISKLVDPKMLIFPFGTTIQNGRTSSLGNDYCSDGYHLNAYGCFTVACTWYEQIFGNVANNPYQPSEFSEKEITVAKIAAKHAVSNPNQITILKN